jgi:hypothetical protein
MIVPAWGVYLAIISARRPDAVRHMQAHCPQIGTWYVAGGEGPTYAAQGAAAVVEAGALCRARNQALADAWRTGYPCLQLSDDLQRCQRMDGTSAVACTLADVVRHMQTTLRQYPAYCLAGGAPTANAYFYHPHRPVGLAHFIVGDACLVRPCDLWFDEQLRLKEDYDYTLQHLAQYGGVVRCNDLLLTFAHRTNKGGAVAYRTPAAERTAIAYLMAKWPGKLRANPTRPQEILLVRDAGTRRQP